MRASAFEPPTIPTGFWERADVHDALQTRDMGRLFTLLRKYAGLSQIRIGTAVSIGQGRMSEIVNGSRAVAATHVFQRIADGLDMPDTARVLLGISPRRELSGGTGMDEPQDDAALLQRITAACRIDHSVIRALRAETDHIRLLDRQLGAPAVAGKLEAHISQLAGSLRYSLQPGCRQQLAWVLADASALAGWQAIDMGQLPRAWTHFERATAAAREAQDSSMLAFAAGEQAYVLSDLHRPAEALTLVRAVFDDTHAAIPHQMRGWLRAAEAEMAANAGRESTCRTALDYAAREIGQGPCEEDLPYLALDDTHLARWRGSCLVLFGDPQTVDDLNAALSTMDSSFARAGAGLRCDLAAALHIRGEDSEAHHHLQYAEELAQVTSSARQRRRIGELAKRLTADA